MSICASMDWKKNGNEKEKPSSQEKIYALV